MRLNKLISILFLMLVNFRLNTLGYVDLRPSICDKEYVATMKGVLEQLLGTANQQPRGSLRANIIEASRRYMILVKRYQELEYRIKYYETNIFSADVTKILERPYLHFFSPCRMDALQYSTGLAINAPTNSRTLEIISMQMFSGQPIAPMVHCENVFKQQMQVAIEYAKGVVGTDSRLKAAKEYMLLFKQYQDVGYNIQLMETFVLPSDIVARLRLPLLAYTRCQNMLTSKNYSVNVDH